MELPNRDLIVDTFIRIRDFNLDAYISQLRSELIPVIRKLQSEGKIIWYGFLIHDHKNLGGRVPPTDRNSYIHIRLSLPEDANIDRFIQQLPPNFQQPTKDSLIPIGGIESSILNNRNWLYGWKVHGEASEWILRMIESHAHEANIPIEQILHFMHYITNPLTIGHTCLFRPRGISF